MLHVLAFAFLAGTSASSPHAPWVSAVSPLIKVRPGMGPSSSRMSYELHAARGACEAFQLQVQAPARAVNAQVEAFAGPGPLAPMKLFREALVAVKTASNSEGAAGLWPDPLIPVLDAQGKPIAHALPFDATDERPLTLYVEACVPARTQPGRYDATVRVTAGAHPEARISVSLHVEPFSIPATSSLPNSFGMSLYSLAHGHGVPPESQEARALLRAYAEQLLSHRLSAHGMGVDPPPATFANGKAKLDFRAYDAEMAPFLEGTALPSGARFTTSDLRLRLHLPDDASRIAYIKAFTDHFRERHWPQTLFFYAKDEPRPKDFPLVLEEGRWVHAAGDGAVLVTAALNKPLLNATDIFCPVLNCFFPRAGPATCPKVQSVPELRARIASRAKVWWYQSCMSHGCDGGPSADAKLEHAYSEWASYMVDHPVTLNRAMGPLAFLTGIDGELYFDVVAAYNDLNPWESVFKFGGNGDGTLFYPGTPDVLGTPGHVPIASLRLKAIRDGLQDYEYLKALDRAGEHAFARSSVRALVRSGSDITRDPKVWEATRAQMADHLRAHAGESAP